MQFLASRRAGAVAIEDDHRYRKQDRLRLPREYRQALRRGRRKRGKRFEVVVASGGSARGARLGIAVSKAVGGAVTRNRTKRIIREYFRRHRPDLPVDIDVVVIARPGAERLTAEDALEIGRLLEASTACTDPRSRRGRPPS